jgi:hypothetical protein
MSPVRHNNRALVRVAAIRELSPQPSRMSNVGSVGSHSTMLTPGKSKGTLGAPESVMMIGKTEPLLHEMMFLLFQRIP